jgi:hypothetical protein
MKRIAWLTGISIFLAALASVAVAQDSSLGDLARQKALDLSDPADRSTLKDQIDQAKQQALSTQLQNATPTPTPTASGKKDKKKSGG